MKSSFEKGLLSINKIKNEGEDGEHDIQSCPYAAEPYFLRKTITENIIIDHASIFSVTDMLDLLQEILSFDEISFISFYLNSACMLTR